MTTSSTALQQIEQLQAQIEQLKHNAILELKSQIIETRRTLSEQEAELAKLTGKPVGELHSAPIRIRHPFIGDDALKPQVLEAVARDGIKGMNARQIALKTGHDPVRIRKFIQDNPKVLKKMGSGAGTKLFLP